MICPRCYAEMNISEHLADLVEWACKRCSPPKAEPVTLNPIDERKCVECGGPLGKRGSRLCVKCHARRGATAANAKRRKGFNDVPIAPPDVNVALEVKLGNYAGVGR